MPRNDVAAVDGGGAVALAAAGCVAADVLDGAVLRGVG